MGRTRAGVAAVLIGTLAVACEQAQGGASASASAPAQTQAASGKQERTYAGCVRRMLGEINFRLVDAVEVKAAGAKPTALRLITAKGKESDLFDFIGHRVEVTGIVGDPLPVNNAMDDVNHLAVTNIKNISDRCR